MLSKLKNWVIWRTIGKKLDIFINTNCNLIMQEFTDIEYLNFKFKGKEYKFEQVKENK